MMDLEEKLRKKGWSDDEIERAINTMLTSEKKPFIVMLDKVTYWVALIVLIFGNFFVSVLLIPFLILTKGFLLYFLIFILAFIFGLLYNILIKDIEKLDTNHKIMAGLFIPALALINIYIITGVSNHMILVFNLNKYNNPIIISFTYLISFIIPYLISNYRFNFFKNR